MTTTHSAMLFKLIDRAAERHDGHLTIMRFTTNWRVGFVTPEGREDIAGLAAGATFILAGEAALKRDGEG